MAAPALLVLLALTCARAELPNESDVLKPFFYHRAVDTLALGEEAEGCMYSGQWFAAGAGVRVRDACLRCRCARGQLACARAACAPPPDPPPRRCVLLHRRNACCPELHCPDGVKTLELGATARLDDDIRDVATPAAPGHACAEDGGMFAAGSALAARAACETCFCLRGARRCVRPRCLPPPAGCAPRPAPGACCPARYYCHNETTTPTPATTHRPHDCLVEGEWVREGEAVAGAACARCFCLRGAVRCQPLQCAPALRGCAPLLRAGHCCPHQYHCPHDNDLTASYWPTISDNALSPSRNDERSLRSSAALLSSTASSSHSTPSASTKVKRKTQETSPTTARPNITETTLTTTTFTTKDKMTDAINTTSSTPASTKVHLPESNLLELTSTEQPESSVRIMINGTINCTAELSSTLPSDVSANDTDKMQEESEARVPGLVHIEAAPAEIITDRSVGASFKDGDSFVVNVTSSLKANSSRPQAVPPSPAPAPEVDLSTLTVAKKTKEDYDYDYTEPTLPPSLPNLKIIPFVAADAVVEDEPAKDETYALLEREDKFPVYYPTVQHKEVPLASRRQDVFSATQYPVFVASKQEPPAPARAPAAPARHTPPTAVRTTTEHTLTTPEVNLFSPPAETEGGFIPKGPGIIEEYYAVYPSTPPPVPHLTTSMQINPGTPDKMECVTSDGRVVAEGESVRVGCATCACAWGELSCAPLRCRTPPRCRRRPASAPHHDLCCGELVCDHNETTTMKPTTMTSTRATEPAMNVTSEPATVTPIESERIPFEPPPDRSEPPVHNPTPDPNTEPPHTETSVPYNDTITKVTPIEHPSISSDRIEKNETTSTTEAAQPLSSTVMPLATVPPPPTTTPAPSPSPDTGDSSQEYEEEEEDEGFSFGSVLKLLLSDSYDTTTVSAVKKKPTTVAATSTFQTPSSQRTTPQPPLPPSSPPSRKPPLKPAVPPFIPMQPHAYIPPKNALPQNALNRIDHLVLGEATAIRKSTPRTTTTRPTTTPARPSTTPARPSTTMKRFTPRTTTRKVATTSRPTTVAEATTERTQPVAVAGVSGGAGLLKLAGCNIYGRMYRVGRIITELSTPCQECRCTELGVQCAPLRC